ncbi:hypothetical protein D3C86_1896860 [compost metagenome]
MRHDAIGAIALAVLLELAVIAAQPLFDVERHHLEGAGRVSRLGAGLQHGARIEMNHAVGAITDAVRCQGEMAVIAAVEIFPDNGCEMLLRLAPEGIADIHVLSRNA